MWLKIRDALDKAMLWMAPHVWVLNVFVLCLCVLQFIPTIFMGMALNGYHVWFAVLFGWNVNEVLNRPHERRLREGHALLASSYKILWEQYNTLAQNYVNAARRDKPS